jgi:regulatory protein
MPRRRSQSSEQDGRRTELTPDQVRRRTFARAIKLISAKSRSVAELRERLLQGSAADKTIVETVIDRLKEYGYLDDQRFAVAYATSRVRQKPLGRNRLRRDLMLKKVNPAVADEALDQLFGEVSEDDLIDQAIAKRIRLRGQPQTLAEGKSLFDHLLRLGFPFELASEKVRATVSPSADDEWN